jgi:hypothetical protein
LPLIALAKVGEAPIGAIMPLTTTSTVKKITSTSSPARVVVKGSVPRCTIIEPKIQLKVGGFDKNKIKHLAVYDNLKSRLTAVADKLALKNIDVTALRADLLVLDTKIKKFSDDYAVYIAELRALQDYTCGKPKSQFLAQLKETKVALVQVHKDAADIRAYYASTLKPEIMKLRATLKSLKATSTPETITSSTATTTNPNN